MDHSRDYLLLQRKESTFIILVIVKDHLFQVICSKRKEKKRKQCITICTKKIL